MPHTVSSKAVVIIDDNRDFADTLATLLKLYGHKPFACYDVETGQRRAEQQRPDIIVLDVGLPGTDGYEVARNFRRNPLFAETVMVAITGHATDTDRRRAHESGFDLHCRKPVNLDDLRTILKHRRASSPDAQLTILDP